MSLTCACWVHSNVYVLGNIHWIRYLTAVDPILSTLSAVQTYHHLISGSVEIWLLTLAENSSSIGKVPVPFGRLILISIRWSATSSLVSYTEKGIVISFTNVLQGYTTVVPFGRLILISIRWSATSSLISYTEKGIVISFTNVLQGYTTVVLVCCTIEWEPDITCTWEVWIFDRMYKGYILSPKPQFLSPFHVEST